MATKSKKKTPKKSAPKSKARVTKRKTKKVVKDSLLNFKANPAEQKLIEQNAKRWANGNLSAWLRRAGSQYAPTRAEQQRFAK